MQSMQRYMDNQSHPPVQNVQNVKDTKKAFSSSNVSSKVGSSTDSSNVVESTKDSLKESLKESDSSNIVMNRNPLFESMVIISEFSPVQARQSTVIVEEDTDDLDKELETELNELNNSKDSKEDSE
jgi:hypothetical protein